MLERMPLTPNGKVDRRALPAPELDAYATSATRLREARWRRSWRASGSRCCGVERVGRHDNFFELGGHSLLIVQMMERLRRVGLSRRSAPMLFESPTLADLASALATARAEQAEVPPNLIPPAARRSRRRCCRWSNWTQAADRRDRRGGSRRRGKHPGHLPAGAAAGGNSVPSPAGDAGGDTYVLPVLLSLSTRERVDALIAALQAVIDRHDILRTACSGSRLPQPVQVVCRQARPAR